MGLLIGLGLAAISTIGTGFAGSDLPPFMSAMFGVGAALYNVFAGTVGGVQIDVE